MATTSLHRRRTSCRICGSGELATILELGPQPLANAYLRSEAEFAGEKLFPLDVCYCRGCSLVQTPDVIDPSVLFSSYVYRSGVSKLMLAHFGDYSRALSRELELGKDDLVVEVASNDGSLLRCFQKEGTQVLGIEPAKNLAAEARAAGIDTVDRFFDEAAAKDIRRERGAARVVVANNVLAHVDDPVGFLRGARALVEPGGATAERGRGGSRSDGGRVVIEVPWLGELIARLEYDTIYHEHLCYFALAPLAVACERAGLELVRVDRVPVHGGSLRLHAEPARGSGHAPSVRAQIDEERRLGLLDEVRFQRFAADVRVHRDALRDTLLELKSSGSSIAAYGAPAKGNTLLNWCRIGTGLVEFTVDRNPDKVGRFTPGMHLPIRPVSALLERQPDVTLILPWNLASEIVAQESEYERRGGRFLVPIPAPKMLEPQKAMR